MPRTHSTRSTGKSWASTKLTAQNNLASAHRTAGQIDTAITLHQEHVLDCMRVHGPTHPETLRSRSNLAAIYRHAGRVDEAITVGDQIVTD